MTKANSNLHAAKKAKNDEFYTQLVDIENEVRHYKNHFKDKIVFCNCDDPVESKFYFYFSQNFENLGLKKLISTHFEAGIPSYKLELQQDINEDGRIDGLDTIRTPLEQNGDFRSPECIAILEEADIVITNPPFSLFREYVAQLIQYKKQFLIIGSENAITYKEIFPLLKNNQMWIGASSSGTMHFTFERDNAETKSVPAIWFTNMDYPKRYEDLILYQKYTPDAYPKYDNYDAINVNKIKDIPMDYMGIMGVPITFMMQHSPDQFSIIGFDYEIKQGRLPHLIDLTWEGKLDRGYINNSRLYSRILIKRK